MFTFNEIEKITGGKIISFAKNQPVQYLLLDTRKITSAQSSIYFAIKGERHDGHKFIREAYAAGVRQFVVENTSSIENISMANVNILAVHSSILALQNIATFHRQKFNFPVLAITGSNGKTIVKEWLYQLLAKDFFIVKSPKSYNSQVGVPISIWGINENHNFGIFEAGISQVGEMEKLQKIIQPTMGLITNIGHAHDEGFESMEQKAIEKLKLFDTIQTIFYCKDHEVLHQLINNAKNPFVKFTWSASDKNANVYIKKIEVSSDQTRIHIIYSNIKNIFITKIKDEASIENLLHCISFLLYQNLEFSEIQNRINYLQPIAMRLELKAGVNNCSIIDDTYNNDISGIAMALNFLSQQNSDKKKTIIFSDILEAGQPDKEVFLTLASMLRGNSISRFIGIGPAIKSNAKLFDHGEFYNTTEEFLNKIDRNTFNNETILIKGARIFQFEKIVSFFLQKVHGTMLHINLDALAHNLNYYRSWLKPQTKIMVMVKAFAYGSGSFEVANLLQFHRVDYLGVAYADEGVALRQNGVKLPIMVMNPSPESFSKLTEFNLEPEIYSFRILNEFQQYIKSQNVASKIHLKMDTGMRRLGFLPEEIESLFAELADNSRLEVASIFTHLAAAEDAAQSDFTQNQIHTFQIAADKIEKKLGYKTLKHGLNSAGIVRYPELQMDMVRLGIGLYGVETNKLHQNKLQEVGTLKTVISQIKKVAAGDTVGYNRRGIVKQNSEIGTLAIGYADGYSRRFGHGVGKVFVNGKICSTIGTVCMDMTMVDLTGADAKEGDEVIIFGKEISVSSMAESIETIPYEILTSVNERVRRVFYAE